MPFQADVYRVMIGSPSDMPDEREAAKTAINDWNTDNAFDEGVVLLPTMYEYAMPEANKRPQQVVNDQIVGPCDILVGMFWTKLGSATGVAESGTVEEIDLCVTAGKPVLLYFSKRPIPPDMIDEEQLGKLRHFKKAIYNTAFCGNFKSPAGLRKILTRHLLIQVRQLKHRAKSAEAPSTLARAPFSISTLSSASMTEIAVCFASIRGFTRFAGSDLAKGRGRVGELLHSLFAAFNKAHDDAMKNLQAGSDFQQEIRLLAEPAAVKSIGGSAMFVWALPQKRGRDDLETGLALFILDFVRFVQDHFYHNIKILEQKLPTIDELRDIDLGVGLSSGVAWKLFGSGSPVHDYVGVPVTAAFVLHDKARPYGVVASLDFAPTLFMERCCAGDGIIDHEKGPDGTKKTAFWQSITRPTIHRRRSRRSGTLKEALDLCLPTDDSDPDPNDHDISLTDNDTVSVFDVRRMWEGRFAMDLAQQVKDNQVSTDSLKPIETTIADSQNILDTSYTAGDQPPPGFKQCGIEFHSRIAELSGSGELDGTERRKFATSIYEFTRKMYPTAATTLQKIVDEHRQIFDAIKNGKPAKAKDKMEKHLGEHYERVKKMLLLK